MCTAITYKSSNHYFGRNLDLDYSYNETVTITPRNYPFDFRFNDTMYSHYAIIGIAYVVNNYPLYYDATNEKGLSIAGLRFSRNAVYNNCTNTKNNIATFELVPWILSQCSTIPEVKKILEHTNITNTNFNSDLPVQPLHWIIADTNESITLECTIAGMKIYDNPVGVLANNPTFDYQLFNLNNYINLSNKTKSNTFSDKIHLSAYSRGMGALGLPGDLSSASRFVKASFSKLNSISFENESDNVNQFFHILDSVCQIKGLVMLENNSYQYTIYSSCCNTNKGIYYYKTYNNSQISGINMHNENLEGNELYSYPLIYDQQIDTIN